MDYDLLKLGIMVINMLVTAGVFIYVRQDRRHKESRSSIEKLEQQMHDKLQQKCSRLTEIEIRLATLPTSDQILRIHTRMDAFHDDMRQIVTMVAEVMGQVKQMNKGD